MADHPGWGGCRRNGPLVRFCQAERCAGARALGGLAPATPAELGDGIGATADWIDRGKVCAGCRLMSWRCRGNGVGVRFAAAFALLAGAACAPQSVPAQEGDVVAALMADFVPRMGDVLIASRPSDCRTDGETVADVPAELFAAFLAANRGDVDGLHLAAHPPRVRIAAGRGSPGAINARTGEPVVALSRIGVAGDAALVCVEVFSVEDRAFFLLLRRDGRGVWLLRAELEAWREHAPWRREPEELPDGRLYEG